MQELKKVYPDWVQQFRAKGTTVKKVGDTYYLYKRTSKRVPGKKYPQAVDTYIGIITPDGVKETKKKKVTKDECIVKEYGFSYVLTSCCPDGFKIAHEQDWQEVLLYAIHDKSPESYLFMDSPISESDKEHHQMAAKISALNRHLYRDYGFNIKDLLVLRTIYIVYLGKERLISKISDEQQEILDKLGIEALT